MSNLKSMLLASAGASAMLLAPLAIMPVSHLPAGYMALAEKGGNGNGKGHADDDQGGAVSDDNGGASADQGEDADEQGDDSGKANKEEKADVRAEVKAARTEAKAAAKAEAGTNLNAELGRLSSLQRDPDALLNSSDPHMAGVRAYVKANAELDAAEATLAEAQAGYDAALDAYGTVVADAAIVSYDGFVYADTDPASLEARLTTLNAVTLDPADPSYPALQAEIADLEAVLGSAEAVTLDAAATAVATAEAEVTDATVGTTDADLTAALAAAANKHGEVSAEVLAWAKAQLGID